MDLLQIKQNVLELRELLRDRGVHFDGAVLFGSRAKGTHRESSDIDLAIISKSYGVDRFSESSQLNLLANRCLPNCDAIPVGLRDYLDCESISPILYEIKKHGILLF